MVRGQVGVVMERDRAGALAAIPVGEAEGLAVLACVRSLGAAQPEFVEECTGLFLLETAADLATIEAALARGDVAAAARDAHRLKGNCAVVGATRMQALCREIEGHAREGAIERAKAEINVLADLFGGVRLALAECRQSLASN